MAVEIKELVIKAVVTNDEDDAPDERSDEAVTNNSKEIIQECVNQVLKILKQHQMR